MDERFGDPLAPPPVPGQVPVAPVRDENVVFAETASDRALPEPTLRDRALNAKTKLTERAVDAKQKLTREARHLTDVTRVKAREGALRAREEFDTRLRTNPLQVIAVSAAAGFVLGLLVRGLANRHERKREFDDRHTLVIE